MPPKGGSATVLTRKNRYHGWKANAVPLRCLGPYAGSKVLLSTVRASIAKEPGYLYQEMYFLHLLLMCVTFIVNVWSEKSASILPNTSCNKLLQSVRYGSNTECHKELLVTIKFI